MSSVSEDTVAREAQDINRFLSMSMLFLLAWGMLRGISYFEIFQFHSYHLYPGPITQLIFNLLTLPSLYPKRLALFAHRRYYTRNNEEPQHLTPLQWTTEMHHLPTPISPSSPPPPRSSIRANTSLLIGCPSQIPSMRRSWRQKFHFGLTPLSGGPRCPYHLHCDYTYPVMWGPSRNRRGDLDDLRLSALIYPGYRKYARHHSGIMKR